MSSTAVAAVERAYARIAEVDRPEVWITLRDRDEVLDEAAGVDRRVAAGEALPLAGRLVAVKDNIDVAGLPTTAACPEFAYRPAETAAAVQRLVRQGAVVLGKTNLDQFATGLVGTRSPYGAVRHASRPDHVSGGSSSGSAVAVALGIADIGIGTDTAGSGRVPAAFHGLIGVKPTLGLVPPDGMVPACRSFDTITVLTRTLAEATEAIHCMQDAVPADLPLGAPPAPTILVPTAAGLTVLTDEGRRAFAAEAADWRGRGATVTEVDVAFLLDAALLLYDGALVAERYEAVGAFLDTEPAHADPTVSAIIRAARDIPAHAYVRDRARLDEVRTAAAALFATADALLLPTVPRHPTLAEVAAEPVAVNKVLGTYTNFVNLLGLSALAIPGGEADGSPFGVTLIGPAFHDAVLADLAARRLEVAPPPAPAGTLALAVFGAHLRGQPLNHQLQALGAAFEREVETSGAYRLYALDTEPPKPGLVRGGPGGAPIRGELWRLSAAGLGRFLGALPPPMALTPVELATGEWVVGFGCSQEAVNTAKEITSFRGWAAYLQSSDRG